MPNVSKIINSDGVSYNIKDNNASHYLGRLNSDEAPTNATITLDGESTPITAKINDWIVLQTKSDAFIWNGTEWVSFGGDSAVLAELVDAGAKNIADFTSTTKTTFTTETSNGVTITRNGDIFTISGTSDTNNNIFFNIYYDGSVSPRMILPGNWVAFIKDYTGSVVKDIAVQSCAPTASPKVYGTPVQFSLSGSESANWVRVNLRPSTTYDGSFRLMICSQEDYAISTKFVPYAKSNYELTVIEDEDRASLVELVDGGAKNLLEVPTTTVTNNGVQFTISNGVITATILSETRADAAIFNITDSLNLKENEEYIFMVGLPSGASSSTYFYDVYDASWANRDVYSITRALESSRKRVRFVVAKEYTGAVGTTIIAKPMICSKAAWKISQTYQPYRPSYQELYEKVETKATVYDIFGTTNKINSGDNLDDYLTPGAYVSPTDSISQSLTNCPVTVAFRLEILQVAAVDRYRQFIYPNGEGMFYIRNRLSGRWSAWYKFEGTAVT